MTTGKYFNDSAVIEREVLRVGSLLDVEKEVKSTVLMNNDGDQVNRLLVSAIFYSCTGENWPLLYKNNANLDHDLRFGTGNKDRSKNL